MPSCPCGWNLEVLPGQVFCGLCGRPCAGLALKPKQLVFYSPRLVEGQAAREVLIQNPLQLELPLHLRVLSNHFTLVGDDGREVQEFHTRLGRKPRTVQVRALGQFPDCETTLQLTSARGRESVRLVAGEQPQWHVEDADADGTAIDVFPKPGNASSPPRLQLSLLHGVAVVEQMKLLREGDEGDEEVGRPVTSPGLPCLMRGGDRLQVDLPLNVWSEQVQARLSIHCANLQPHEIPLTIHGSQPVDVTFQPLVEFDQAFSFSSSSPAEFRIKLYNQGGWGAWLEEVDCSDSPFELVEIRLINHKDGGGHFDVPIQPRRDLPAKVLDATLPGPAGGAARPSEATLEVDSLLLRTHAGALKAIRPDGILEGEIRVFAAAERLRPDPQVLRVSVRARVIQDLPPEKGYLLVDYGTVHTCATLRLLDSSGRVIYKPVDLDPSSEEGAQPRQQMKSCYWVKRWHSQAEPEVEYGHQAWPHRGTRFTGTDYAAKLRLGNRAQRYILDNENVVRPVGGVEAARILLSKVLFRVAQETGYRPQSFKLSHPVAFDDASREDLIRVFTSLGMDPQHVEIARSEPESFLMCVLTVMKDMLEAVHQDLLARGVLASPEQGLVGMIFDFGGGTTDVTVFEYYAEPMSRVRIVGSHGYSWLGGEALTARIAAHLHGTIEVPQRYPFPILGDERDFFLRALGAMSKAHATRRNYEHLCERAERIKCEEAERVKARLDGQRTETINLVDVEDRGDTPTIHIDRDAMASIADTMIAPAINDTLRRILMSNTFGLLCHFKPHLVIAAGNASRLWCLEDIFKHHCGDDVKYLFPDDFPKDIAKTGVIDGLDADYAGLGVQIEPPRGDCHWWYWARGVGFQMVHYGPPPPTDVKNPGELLPFSDKAVPFAAWNFYHGKGPGAEDEGPIIGRHEDMRYVGIIDPGPYGGQAVVPRFGFRGERPGVWVEVQEPGKVQRHWKWFPILTGEREVGR